MQKPSLRQWYQKTKSSTKLLLHPKDVPELHFPKESNTDTVEQVVINNLTESLVETATKHHKTSEIPPETKIDKDNRDTRCLLKSVGKQDEISPVKSDILAHNNQGEPQSENWFAFSVTGMSKLSNAFKKGLFSQTGGCPTDMATHLWHGNEDKGFSLFL